VKPAGVREIVGVPTLPPACVIKLGTQARGWVGRAHRSMVPPPVRVLEGLFGLLDYGALVALDTLGLPAALDRRMTVQELGTALQVPVDGLERLVRYSATRGWLKFDRRGRVAPNSTTKFLRTAHPGGWSAWVPFLAGDEIVASVTSLGEAIRTDGDAFQLANGATFFEWMADNPARHRAFDEAMAAGGQMHGLTLARSLDWTTSRRVCDVGGGDGALLRTLLDKHPHLSGVVLDLPEVTARSKPAERLESLAGDAFQHLPADCDTYLFVNVLHDWDDDDAVRLLERAASDGPAGARIVVVEGHRSSRPGDDIAARTDLLMLALAPGGRERTGQQFEMLGRRAGLRLDKTVSLASTDYAHVFTH